MPSVTIWTLGVIVSLTIVTSLSETVIVHNVQLDTRIRDRLAETRLLVEVQGKQGEDSEAFFYLNIPRKAIVTQFVKRESVEVTEGSVVFISSDTATNESLWAGTTGVRRSDEILLIVNLKPNQTCIVSFIYKEILERRNSLYKPTLYFNTDHPVKTFDIGYQIEFSQPFTLLRMAPLTEEELDAEGNVLTDYSDLVTPETLNPALAKVGYRSVNNTWGIFARFAVEFDVLHTPGGDIVIEDGYFLHSVVPDHLGRSVPMDAIFLLAMSSLYSPLFEKIKEGITNILLTFNGNEVENRAMIITESTTAQNLRQSFRNAGVDMFTNRQVTDNFLFNISASGLEFLGNAFDFSLGLQTHFADRFYYRPCVVFVVVDEDYSGINDTERMELLNTIKSENKNPCAIFVASVGEAGDIGFLEKLSAQNFGFVRKIYDLPDANTQLFSLFTEVFDVVIGGMSIEYGNQIVNETSLSNTYFPIVVNNTEVTVCGRLLQDDLPFSLVINGHVRDDTRQESRLFSKSNHKVTLSSLDSHPVQENSGLVSETCEILKAMQGLEQED